MLISRFCRFRRGLVSSIFHGLCLMSILVNVFLLCLYSSESSQTYVLKAELDRLRTLIPSNGHPGGGPGSDSTVHPTIYVITPTYARLVQKAELTRLCHTFRLVPNLHWILVEDSPENTPLVTRFLKDCSVPSTQLSVQTPQEFKMNTSDPRWLKPRGVLQRNLGLKWVRENAQEGVLYLADDDNTYDLRLFEEMRTTRRVSVWPVAFVGDLRYERPVCRDGHVISWFTAWRPERPFPMDMAGFAVHVSLLHKHPSAQFQVDAKRGYQESVFLKTMVTMKDLEPRADNCSTVLVWHTRSERPNLNQEENLRRRGVAGSDPSVEV